MSIPKERKSSIPISIMKERPPLLGRVLLLNPGKSGIISEKEADYVVAESLDDSAFVFMSGITRENIIFTGGVNYCSPREDKGKISELYRELKNQHQVEKISVGVVWGWVIEKEEEEKKESALKKSVLKELNELINRKFPFIFPKSSLDIDLGGATERVSISAKGEIFFGVPKEIRKQVEALRRKEAIRHYEEFLERSNDYSRALLLNKEDLAKIEHYQSPSPDITSGTSMLPGIITFKIGEEVFRLRVVNVYGKPYGGEDSSKEIMAVCASNESLNEWLEGSMTPINVVKKGCHREILEAIEGEKPAVISLDLEKGRKMPQSLSEVKVYNLK